LYNGPLLCGFYVPIKGLNSVARTLVGTRQPKDVTLTPLNK